MTVNFNQKKKNMFITPATKKTKNKKQLNLPFIQVNLAASMKLEIFFLAN